MQLEKEIERLLSDNKQSEIFPMNMLTIKQRRVAVIGENTEQVLNVILNLLASNKVVVPIHPKLPAENREYLCSLADVDLIITDNKELESGRLKVPIIYIDDLYSNLKESNLINKKYSAQLVNCPMIFFTSGTTGRSKAAVLKKVALEQLFSTMMEALEVSNLDCLLMYTHISFIQSFWSALIVLFSKGKIILKRKMEYEHFFDELDYYNATMTVGVPTMLNKIVRQYSTTIRPLRNLRCIISGGEILNVHNTKRLLSTLRNTSIANAYGMVETTAVCTLYYGRDFNRMDSVGKPLNNIQVIIKNKSIDGIGEILISSPRIMNGYYPTTLDQEDHWINTGDLGYIDDDGDLHVLSRKTLTINKGGGED